MSELDPPKPAIFVDRDGTLIEEVDHLSNVRDLVIFPSSLTAVKLLKTNGFLVIVITNQSGIGRGYFNELSMRSIHDEISLEMHDGIDGFYFCPHLPDAGCRCRKPGLGMIEDACRDFAIDMSRSWMIGDKNIDIETGHNAGIKSAMVSTGYGMIHKRLLQQQPEIIADDLLDAVEKLLALAR